MLINIFKIKDRIEVENTNTTASYEKMEILNVGEPLILFQT